MFRKIIGVMLLSAALFHPVFGQDSSPHTARLAFEQEGALYVLEPNSETPILIDDTRQNKYNAVWSPDGTLLAYLGRSEELGQPSDVLRVWDGTQILDVATFDKGNEIPLNWTADGQILYVVSPVAEEPDFEEVFIYQPVSGQVYTITPAPRARPTWIAEIPICFEAGRRSLSDVYNRDQPTILIQLTDAGLIYPANCIDYQEDDVYEGYNGMWFPFATQEPVALKYGLFEPRLLSADQNHVIGYLYGVKGDVALTDIDLATTDDTEYYQPRVVRGATEDANPAHYQLNEPLAQDSEGNLYYSFEDEEGDLLGPELNAAHANSLRWYGYMMSVGWYKPESDDIFIPYNTVGVYRLTPPRKNSIVFEGLDAYSIERMQIVGSTLYFSVTTNGYTLRQALEDGTLVIDAESNEEYLNTFAPYMETDIYAVDLSSADPTPTLIVKNAHHFAVGQP